MRYPYYKCELHCHLDGSLPPETGWKLAKQLALSSDFPSFNEYIKHTQVDNHCHSLYEYLACFDAPLKILQYQEAIELCAYTLGKQLAKEHVRYAEIRFAPQQHNKLELHQEDVIQAVLRGFEKVMKEEHIYLQGILCMMVLPNDTGKENEETLRLCKKYLHHGICGLDLAGAEGVREMEEFHPYFKEAAKCGIPFTIHAGENGYPDHIQQAISYGALRIGHGVHCIHHNELLQTLIEKQIPLEICYTSNIQCHVFSKQDIHPIRQLFDLGVPITINTDNRSISNTTLDQEYERLQQDYYFTIEEIKACNETAIRHAFLEESKKQLLLKEMQEKRW